MPPADLDAVSVLTTHLQAAHATLTDGQTALTENYRTVTRLLADVRLRLANPDRGDGPYDDLIDDVDRRLIALLDRGTKRTALAAEADITPYDMSRRIRRLYDVTGSTMQFQFGRACVSRLWVPPDPGTPRVS